MIVTSTLVILFLVSGLGGFSGFFDTLETKYPESLTVPGNGFFDFLTFIGMTVPWMFFSLSNPQVSQRLYMPASMKDLKVMILIFMIFGLVYTLVAIFWGFSATILFPNLENVDMATPLLLSSELVPPILGVIVMVGIMAAAISTIDSILLTLSSVFAKDVYGNLRKGATDRMQLQIGKIVIPVIAILAYFFAELELNLIALLSVASSAGLIIVVPAIFGTFFWRKGTAAGVLASVSITGIIVILLEAFQWRPLGLASGIWGIVLSTVIFIMVSLFTTPPKEKAEEFLGFIKTALQTEKRR
jgi:SSS family solute:Na+ symporter